MVLLGTKARAQDVGKGVGGTGGRQPAPAALRRKETGAVQHDRGEERLLRRRGASFSLFAKSRRGG